MSQRASERGLFGVCALLFAASAAMTIAWCGSMSSLGEMSLAGGATMSMTFMRMPGQTWLTSAGSFLGMWLVMMVAMMLPALAPMLGRYRRTLGATAMTRGAGLTLVVALAYFLVWCALGAAVFPLGAALAALEMQAPALARAAPIAAGAVMLLAGLLQFSSWKAHRLACCREPAPGAPSATVGAACRHGLRLGLDCCYCCGGLTAILLVVGVMDPRVMAVVTAAITLERLAPAGARVARATGGVAVLAGVLWIARASGL